MTDENKTWFNDLVSKYPRLFKTYKWIECGKGWNTILEHAFWLIDNHIGRVSNEERETFEVVQVKEKFGTLRCYTSTTDDYISGVIAMAESISCSTCEHCGMPGKRRSRGWIQTLCDKCWDENHKPNTCIDCEQPGQFRDEYGEELCSKCYMDRENEEDE